MTMGHTKGPWAITSFEGDEHAFISAAGDTQEGGIFVANVGGPNYAANARLIAAAPSLLTALREMVEATEELNSSEPDMPSHEATCARFEAAHEAARAALKLAQGNG